MKRLHFFCIFALLLSVVSCNRPDELAPDVPGVFNVNFRDADAQHQAVQEAPAVDRLLIDVYESESTSPVTYSYNVKDGVVERGIDIPFKEGGSYELYFWAQKGSGSVYSVKPGSIRDGATIKYPANFKSDDLASFDSYSASAKFIYPDGLPSEIQMSRNVAKLDFVFYKDKLAENKVSKIEVSIEGLPDAVVFTGDESGAEGKASYRFENLTDLKDYNLDSRISCLGTGYLPVNGSSPVRIAMKMSDSSGNKVGSTVEDELGLKAGMSTALIFNGDRLVWKGIQDNSVPSTPAKDGWIHISSVGEFAALLAGGGQKGAKYHICNDMDMSLLPLSITKDFRSDAMFEDICIDGGIYAAESVPNDYKVNPQGTVRIFNLELPSASGIFANVRNFEATNLVIEDVIVGKESENQEGTGVLIGKSYGKVTLKNVKVKDSEAIAPRRIGGAIGAVYGGEVMLNDCDLTSVKVSTSYKKGASGQAGGLIGYIGRKSEKERSEKLDVTIFKCELQGCKVTAYMQSEELHSGRLVGTLSGYDNGEKLSIILSTADAKTTLSHTGEGRDETARKGTGRYTNAHKSAFCADLPAEYEDLIGGQVYHRGLVRFGNYQVETQLKEFIPRWDGVTVITPLKADPEYDGDVNAGETAYVVYSPADLVGLREATSTPEAIYLAANVDMNGQGEDGEYNVPENFADSYHKSDDDNLFAPFTRVRLLEGNGNTIYNLGICQHNATSTAFIKSANETTVHRNISFRNCCVIGTHTEVETNSTAQAAIVCSNAGGKSYTMQNVNAYDCKVFGVQKIGTLVSNLSASKSNISGCNVERSYIENYEVFIDELFTGSFEYQGFSVTASQSFYPHGEVGGLIGFVSGNASIEKCSVSESEINCYGLDDIAADISPSAVERLLDVIGYYFVPGRHVSSFIGDIRTISGESINISNCRTDSKTKCTRRWDKYCWMTLSNTHKTFPYIGSCYYVAFLDKIGTVTIDGERINLHDCRKTSACYEHNIH
ncbi:MAG: FimB/Mfa2 family fimbrial subunit [Bacteroidales bacterium]|nr:FimB/Mfa2 family fimbrial subunit [Bacteroidales bacterium]